MKIYRTESSTEKILMIVIIHVIKFLKIFWNCRKKTEESCFQIVVGTEKRQNKAETGLFVTVRRNNN